MFTGIIEIAAKVLEKTDFGLVLERPKIFNDLKIGCSIAVSGVCLSVTAFDESSMYFDVIKTTLQKSKLGSLKAGDRVNLERAMKANGRFEGHIVTGHVEGVGEVVSAPCALSPSPSPVPGEGDAAQGDQHVWKGVEGLKYAPSSVVSNARAMRKAPTQAEDVLWQELRKQKMNGHYFRRQRPIGACIVDFYCEESKLAIEVDGGIHDQEDQQKFDQWRTEGLEARGVHLIRFTNDEVMNHLTDVIASIKNHMEFPLSPKGRGARGEGTDEKGRDTLLTIEVPARLLPSIVSEGSITLDGVALTVAKLLPLSPPAPRSLGEVGKGGGVRGGGFITVSLIPHTLQLTTLGTLQKGDYVNIETDILAKYLLNAHDQK